MKLVEVYAQMYLHALINIFIKKLLCMHDAVTYNIVAIYIALYSIDKILNLTLHISRRNSDGKVLGS